MDFNFFKNKKGTILTVIALFIILGTGFSLINEFRYSADTKVLVYQKFPAGTDIYSINRSNEYLSSVLAEVIPSDSFYDAVMNSGFNIDQNYFTKEKNTRDILKKWSKALEVRPAMDSGILDINVYHPDPNQAEQIARAINFVLVTKNQDYHGGGDSVVVKVINKPVVSAWPVRPNLPLNLGLSLLIGLTLAFTYVYLFPEKKYDLSFWPWRKNIYKIKNYEDSIDTTSRAKTDWHSVASLLKDKKEGRGAMALAEKNGGPDERVRSEEVAIPAGEPQVHSTPIHEELRIDAARVEEIVPVSENFLGRGTMENLLNRN